MTSTREYPPSSQISFLVNLRPSKLPVWSPTRRARGRSERRCSERFVVRQLRPRISRIEPARLATRRISFRQPGCLPVEVRGFAPPPRGRFSFFQELLTIYPCDK